MGIGDVYGYIRILASSVTWVTSERGRGAKEEAKKEGTGGAGSVLVRPEISLPFFPSLFSASFPGVSLKKKLLKVCFCYPV